MRCTWEALSIDANICFLATPHKGLMGENTRCRVLTNFIFAKWQLLIASYETDNVRTRSATNIHRWSWFARASTFFLPSFMDKSTRSALQSNTALHTFWLIRLGFSQINQKTHIPSIGNTRKFAHHTHTHYAHIHQGRQTWILSCKPVWTNIQTTQCLPLCVSNRCYRRPSQHKQCHWFQQFRLKWILCGTRSVARETSRSQHNSINIQSIPMTVAVDFFSAASPQALFHLSRRFHFAASFQCVQQKMPWKVWCPEQTHSLLSMEHVSSHFSDKMKTVHT